MFEEFIAKIKKNRKMDAKTINGELVAIIPDLTVGSVMKVGGIINDPDALIEVREGKKANGDILEVVTITSSNPRKSERGRKPGSVVKEEVSIELI